MRILVATTVIVLLGATSAGAVSGALGGGLGVAMPRGQLNRYANNSFTLGGYGRLDIPGMPNFGVRLGLQDLFLENHSHDVNLGGWLFTEDYSTNLWKFTLGAEFAPALYPLEPYVGAGVGLYYFSNGVSLKDPSGEELESKTLASEADVGWNAGGGLRLYFTPEVAMDVGIQYDKIRNMKSLKAYGDYEQPEIVSESLDSEFVTLLVGIHVRPR